MINRATYQNAATVAKELAESGVYLQARPSTLLGELMNLSTSVDTIQTTNLPTILANPNSRGDNLLRSMEDRAVDVECTTINSETPSLHSLKIAALADDIAPFITAHISLARNTVAPLVTELAGKLEKYLQVARPVDPVSMFEIDKRSIPELLLDESFLAGGLEAYEGIDANWQPFNIELDLPADEAFYESLVSQGNDRLNGLVQDWLSSKGKDFVKAVYACNFANQHYESPEGGVKYYNYSEPGMGDNPYDVLDLSLCMYLIGTRLFSDVQPAKGVSLGQYKSSLRAVIDYAGAQTIKSLKVIRRQIAGNVLVSEAVLSRKRVVVNNTLYQAWLQAGGKPEILLGMLVSGQVQYSVAGIDAARESLLRQWETFVTLSQVNIRAELLKRFRIYAETETMAGLAELTDIEKDFSLNCKNLRDKVSVLVQAEIEHLNHRIMDDVYHTALHLVAKARFYYTSSYSILSQMVEVAKINPDIDPREAALLSAISYIADYTEPQIVKVG